MSDKVFHIGVMIGNVHTQHPMELITGICEAAKEENVHITFFVGAQGNALDFWNGDNNDLSAYNYQYNSLYDYSLIAGLDALIISYGTLCIYLDQDDREAFAGKFRANPLVILEEYDESSQDSFIISDNFASMYEIMEHLIRVHGYRKILYLSGPKNNTDSNERERAYRTAMEKYNLQVDESMIVYGDYSSEVDNLVEQLLDNNPDAEAIVSANDEMALSVYRVCHKRGIVVGRDLAVTGYDDVDFAQRLDPPLTTANQDGLDMGSRALKCAISLCKDPTPVKIKIPARFMNRLSCGCDLKSIDPMDNLKNSLMQAEGDVAKAAVRASFKSIAPGQDLADGMEYFTRLIQLLQNVVTDQDLRDKAGAEALVLIQTLCDRQGHGSLSVSGLIGSFHRVLHSYMEKTDEKELLMLYENILAITDTYINSYVMHESEKRITMLLNHSWIAPATILYMIEKVEDEKAFYRLALENTIAQGAKSAYLYLLPQPLEYDRNQEFQCPDKLLLAARYDEGQIRTYNIKERPVITRTESFSSLYPKNGKHSYVAFMLFARTYQYGILICEIEAASIGLLYGVALQISTAMAYRQISRQENETKQQLYVTLKQLREKNRLLSFVSATDELTGLYNRRGFMEEAMEKVYANVGKKAAIFFSDLDHLKQINDVFGHQDGDFAIRNTGRILKETLAEVSRDQAVCGRIGGDEFVAMMLCETDQDADQVCERLRQNCSAFNDSSNKPYYVEFSVGSVTFTCNENISVAELTSQADACLYEAKKRRRSSVLKEEK